MLDTWSSNTYPSGIQYFRIRILEGAHTTMEDISLIDKFARKRKNSSTIVLKVQYQNNYTQQKKKKTRQL